MPKIVDRIALIVGGKSLSIRAFEMSIGASNGMIGRAVSKGTDISAEWLSKIIEAHPDVSAEWLLTGRGQMLRNGQPDPAAPPPAIEAPPPKVIYESDPRDAERIKHLEELLEAKNETIASKNETITTKDQALEDCRKSIEDRDKYVAMLECRLTNNGSEPTQSEDLDPARSAMESSYIAPGKKSISTSRG